MQTVGTKPFTPTGGRSSGNGRPSAAHGNNFDKNLNNLNNMKKIMLIPVLLLSFFTAIAKDIKVVVLTTNPVMHCISCENKIKGNIRFEKGIKKIETNVEKQEVTIVYDADKTNVEKIAQGFEKIGYQTKVVRRDDKKDGEKKDK